MNTSDLTKVEALVNESKQYFLNAVESCEKDGAADAEAVTERFLEKFLGPDSKRSNITRNNARQAIQLIKDFGKIQASFTSNAAILWVKMEQGVLAQSLDVLRKTVQMAGQKSEAITKEMNLATQRAVAIGEHVAKYQKLAADLMLLRLATLKKFRGENLEISWAGIKERMRKTIEEEFKSKAGDTLAETIAEGIKKLAEVASKTVLNVHGIGIVLEWGWKVYRLLRPRIDFRPGVNDLMEKLLEELENENALFRNLETAYENTYDDLCKLSEAAS